MPCISWQNDRTVHTDVSFVCNIPVNLNYGWHAILNLQKNRWTEYKFCTANYCKQGAMKANLSVISTHHARLTTRRDHFLEPPITADTGSQTLNISIQHSLGGLQCQLLQFSEAQGNGGITGIPVADYSLQ